MCSLYAGVCVCSVCPWPRGELLGLYSLSSFFLHKDWKNCWQFQVLLFFYWSSSRPAQAFDGADVKDFLVVLPVRRHSVTIVTQDHNGSGRTKSLLPRLERRASSSDPAEDARVFPTRVSALECLCVSTGRLQQERSTPSSPRCSFHHFFSHLLSLCRHVCLLFFSSLCLSSPLCPFASFRLLPPALCFLSSHRSFWLALNPAAQSFFFSFFFFCVFILPLIQHRWAGDLKLASSQPCPRLPLPLLRALHCLCCVGGERS